MYLISMSQNHGQVHGERKIRNFFMYLIIIPIRDFKNKKRGNKGKEKEKKDRRKKRKETKMIRYSDVNFNQNEILQNQRAA